MYQFYIFAPNDPEIIMNIINAAADAGAGIVGKYTHCAFVTTGYGTWYPLPSAQPLIGKVGELSREAEVKIEMECPKEKMRDVFSAVKKVHPYETCTIIATPVEVFK